MGEVVLVRHARGERAQPRERAQQQVGGEPDTDPRRREREQPEHEQPLPELALALLQRLEARDDLQAGEAAEVRVAQRRDVRAVVVAVGAEGLQPEPERA